MMHIKHLTVYDSALPISCNKSSPHCLAKSTRDMLYHNSQNVTMQLVVEMAPSNLSIDKITRAMDQLEPFGRR